MNANFLNTRTVPLAVIEVSEKCLETYFKGPAQEIRSNEYGAGLAFFGKTPSGTSIELICYKESLWPTEYQLDVADKSLVKTISDVENLVNEITGALKLEKAAVKWKNHLEFNPLEVKNMTEAASGNAFKKLTKKEQLAKMKLTLKNFPDEVLDSWILPYAEIIGFPPPLDHANTPTGRWGNLLDAKSLYYWQNIRWTKQYVDINLTLNVFDSETKEYLARLLDKIKHDEGDHYQRAHSVLNHLNSQGGNIPVPIVLIKDESGLFSIIDGFHRVFAYLSYLTVATNQRPQSCWVGEETIT